MQQVAFVVFHSTPVFPVCANLFIVYLFDWSLVTRLLSECGVAMTKSCKVFSYWSVCLASFSIFTKLFPWELCMFDLFTPRLILNAAG